MPAKKSLSKSHADAPLSFDPVSRGAKPGVDHRAVFKERVNAITKDTKVAILHDTDADGLCSAIIVAKAVERMRGKPVDAVVYQAHKNVGIQKDTIENLKKQKIDVLFTVDKPIDEEPESVKEASLFFKIPRQSQYDFGIVEARLAASAFSDTALKPRPGGSIRPFCDPVTVTSTSHSS